MHLPFDAVDLEQPAATEVRASIGVAVAYIGAGGRIGGVALLVFLAHAVATEGAVNVADDAERSVGVADRVAGRVAGLAGSLDDTVAADRRAGRQAGRGAAIAIEAVAIVALLPGPDRAVAAGRQDLVEVDVAGERTEQRVGPCRGDGRRDPLGRFEDPRCKPGAIDRERMTAAGPAQDQVVGLTIDEGEVEADAVGCVAGGFAGEGCGGDREQGRDDASDRQGTDSPPVGAASAPA